MKPLVGVIPLYDDEKKSWWMLPGYLEGLAEAGLHPVVLSFTDTEDDFFETAGQYSGFLFTGGQDIEPHLYGEEPAAQCGIVNETRDYMEMCAFHYCYDNDVPLLGICRGLQMINILAGGTLYQDLNTQYHGSHYVQHDMNAPYDRPQHTVSILDNTPLSTLLKQKKAGVNSLHHQAIRKLGSYLKPMAVSEDGLIEAAYFPNRLYIQGVQWHPEYDFKSNENSRLIFQSFADACRDYQCRLQA